MQKIYLYYYFDKELYRYVKYLQIGIFLSK